MFCRNYLLWVILLANFFFIHNSSNTEVSKYCIFSWFLLRKEKNPNKIFLNQLIQINYLLNCWTISVRSIERHERTCFQCFCFSTGTRTWNCCCGKHEYVWSSDHWLCNKSSAFDNIHDVNGLICSEWVRIEFFSME